jgi:hypothetical protein
MESTRNWALMYDLVSEHVDRVELPHPKEVKAIANAAVDVPHTSIVFTAIVEAISTLDGPQAEKMIPKRTNKIKNLAYLFI